MTAAIDTVRRWVEAVNDRDFAVFTSLMAPGYVNHHRPYAQDDGVPGVQRFFAELCDAIDGFRYDIAALEQEDDGIVRLVLRGSGTLTRPFAGVDHLGPVTVAVTHRYRVVDGLIAERWGDPVDPFRIVPAGATA